LKVNPLMSLFLMAELAQRATQIRQITEEGLRVDEIQRQRVQRAAASWFYFGGGTLLIIAGLLSSALLAQETGHGLLVSTYDRYEATRDTVTKNIITFGTMGFGSADIDKPFLPESIARASLYGIEPKSIANFNYSNQIPLLQNVLLHVKFLQSEAEQEFTLTGKRLELLPVCRDFVASRSLVFSQKNSINRCSVGLGRRTCAEKESAWNSYSYQLVEIDKIIASCDSTEGILIALSSKGLLGQYSVLLYNYNRTVAFLDSHIRSEIPYTNLTLDYVEEILERIHLGLHTNLTSTILLDEALNYYTHRLAYNYLATIDTLLTSQIQSYTSLKELNSQLGGRQTREEQYAKVRQRFEVERTRCIETNSQTLICRELHSQYTKVTMWINSMERFQLPLPMNFVDLVYEALLVPEITTVASVRDFQRYRRVEDFKKNPSWSFLILMSLFGIGGFIMAKMILFDCMFTYVNLLILPGEYLNEQLRYSIDTVKAKRLLITVPAAPLLKDE
jgi:hypothetical protein